MEPNELKSEIVNSAREKEETKEFKIQNMSGWSSFFFVFAAPLSFLFVLEIAVGLGGGVFSFIIGIVAIVALMIFLFRYLQQKILVTTKQDTIQVNYLHTPFFESRADMDISINDIASYKFDSFNGVRFILYLKDGRRFRVAMGSIGNTAVAEQMAQHIIAMITAKQESSVDKGAAPMRRKTYAEGTTGLVLAIVVIVLMIVMAVAIIFFPQNHNSGDTVRGIGVMATCLAFVLHVFNLRRKAKKEQEENTNADS